MPDVALSAYPLPAMLTLRFENVATPLTAETLTVPPRIALVVLFSLALKQSETDQRRRERLEDAATA